MQWTSKVPRAHRGHLAAPIAFLLTARRDTAAAKRFFDKAIGSSGIPEKIKMDKSGANKAAVDALNETQKQKK